MTTTGTDYPPPPAEALAERANLVVALEDVFAQHATEPALQHRDQVLTYGALGARARCVAAAITAQIAPHRDMGGEDPVVVAVVLDRSVDLIGAVLGVVMAGAAYLPVDAQAPDPYVEGLLTEARPQLVVTDQPRAAGLALAGHPVVVVDDLTGDPPAGPDAAGVVAPCADDPAYVIYTSGSTGRPKGVVVSHGALLNSTAARLGAYGVPTRMPLVHSIAFDLSSGVIFWALLTGGTLVISPVELRDVAGTLALVHSENITHLVYPASLYAPFLDRAAARPPAGLRAVMIGSERWSPTLINLHARHLPAASLYNEYGPTEACVWSSYACVYDATIGERAPLTIGQPLPGVGYRVLDPAGRPLPVGEEGELYITGRNLALGYLHRPDLTAERFGDLEPGERAYRSGDLVRQTPAGDYEFIGRVDRQLKVGGNRIEAGHVETVLMGSPDIVGAYVTTRDDLGVGATLVAYLVTRVPLASDRDAGAGQLTTARLRALVADSLPAYMVPSVFVPVDELPATRNGKIDEARLPAPTRPGTSDRVEPADPIEAELAAMVGEILGTSDTVLDTSLIEQGASSLSIVSLAAAIAHRWAVEVAPSAMFAAPTIRALAERIRTAPATDKPALVPTDRSSAAAPLSPQQRQIWVLHHLDPDSGAYNTQFSLRLSGRLDVAALEGALSHLVARHEVLRTTFHDTPDGPVQVVHDPWPVTVEVEDLTDLDEPDRQREMTRRAGAAMAIRFDIAALPLVTWRLYKLADDKWSLLQVEHHFAHDGWSASLLLGELRDVYRALTTGHTPDLPTLGVQYRDYARWHQRWRHSGDYAAQTRYWLDRLDGCPPVGVTFEADHPRPAKQGFRGGCVRATIPAGTVARLDEICERHQVTRFAACLAGFALQAWRHTGDTDLVIGSALSNRRLPGTAGMVGMLVNALPLRLRIDPDATVGANVASVMATITGAQDHQELPLVDLVAQLGAPRDPARNPLFSLMFAFHDSPRPRFTAAGLGGELWIEHNGTAKNDVNVVCVPNPAQPGAALGHDGLDVLWEYNEDLFDAGTARRLLDGFLHIVETLPGCWDHPVADVEMLAPAETARILDAGHGPDAPAPFATLHAGVDARIRVDPDATAIVAGATAVTYRDLDAAARAIGDRLAQRGVGAGDVVGVAVPKSVQLVATCLAILRAGAAYVCLDPTQPSARLRFLTTDTNTAAVVATAATRDRLASHLAIPILDLDAPSDHPDGNDGTGGPPIRAAAGREGPPVAYLTYTSGSSGAPKAVVTTNPNAVAALDARTTYFGATAPRTLVTLPAIFDVAGSMIFWTLWLGGTVVFPDADTTAVDPDQVRALVERHQITHVNFTASWYRQFLASLSGTWRAPLRVVAIGGEAPGAEVAALHAQRLPDTELHNEYGPTEATVWCSATCLHRPGDPPAGGPVTIGRPLANCSLFVLDHHRRLAPIGAAGELYVGGPGVAAGYLARPELTAGSFVDVEQGPLAGMRLYRTGDRARLLADGRFVVTGRLDDQVKVRGYRIELGEVEQCLTGHPRVTTAAVVVADKPTRLVAYVVAAPPGSNPGSGLVDELGRWTAQRLPAYMAPSAYVILDELPVTPSGKIDRARLPAPSMGDQAQPGHVEPVTLLQGQLLELFRSALGRPDIGLDDDFFAQGGDSLQAISLSARARTAGLDLPVSLVLRTRSVRALAAAVDHQPTGQPVAGRRAGARLPLTPIQGWFFDQGFAEPHHFNQARLFDIDPAIPTETLRAALGWVLARHDAFRTRFERTPAGWAAVLDAEPPQVPVPETPLPTGTTRNLADRVRDALDPLHAGLDIGAGPLVRAALLTDGSTPRRWLALVIHHLLIDTVSWGILARDLDHACARLTAGEPLEDQPAPGVPDQPTDPPTAAEIDYWQRLAATVPSGRPAVTSPATVGKLCHTERTLSPHATRHLTDSTPRLYEATAWSMLLAALAEALAPITGTRDLYALIEGHGRDDLHHADQIVGWLTSLYPVLLRPTDGAAALAQTAAAFHRQLADVPGAGANFGRARYLAPGSPLGRVLAGLDLPALTVNYRGHGANTPQATVRPSPLPTGAAIGPGNVLPTPLHLTAAGTGDSMVLRCSYDPALGDAAIDAACTRLAVTLEHAARVVALTDQPTDPAAPQLFFIHPVGGRVEAYAPLARRLASRWRSYGLAQVAPAASIDELAATHAATISVLQPTGPYTLAGWSFGAAVAYETARRLEAQSRGPTLVTLLDPPTPPRTPDDAAEALTAQLSSVIPDVPLAAVRAAVDDTSSTPVTNRARELIRRLGADGDRFTCGQVAMLVANHAAFTRWHPSGPVTRLQVVIPRAAAHRAPATTATWQPHAHQPITVVVAGGDHHSMLAGDADEIAETLAGAHRPAS